MPVAGTAVRTFADTEGCMLADCIVVDMLVEAPLLAVLQRLPLPRECESFRELEASLLPDFDDQEVLIELRLARCLARSRELSDRGMP